MRLEPAAVINCAAFTRVDLAETQPAESFLVNAAAVEAIATVCQELDCPLLQVSTDYVFGSDLDRRVPYRETDVPGPVNVYGRSKLAGEDAARSCHKHFIVRTCGLFADSPHGPQRGRNFADTMLLLARERPSLRIVNDQTCTPSYVPQMASAMLRLLFAAPHGTYHLTHRGATTWFGFANELFRQAGITLPVTPISTADYAAAAARPAYSVLDTSKFESLNFPRMPEWQHGVRSYLDALATHGVKWRAA